MLIDYIYFILIIIIICFIIFLIYLSYEYSSTDKIEYFTLPPINNSINNNLNIITNLETNLLNNYLKFANDTENNNINYINANTLNVNNQITKNLQNSKSLLQMKFGIIPQPITYPLDKPIKTIKSNYNSQYLSTFPNDTKDSTSYSVLANDKCLTVKGLCTGEFCVLDCQKSLNASNSQKFTTDRINSSVDAARIMNVDISKINTANIYPFNIFRSKINSHCLTINDNGITVEKCNLNNKKQQWQISPDDNICYLT